MQRMSRPWPPLLRGSKRWTQAQATTLLLLRTGELVVVGARSEKWTMVEVLI
jgi:hypothetical protein